MYIHTLDALRTLTLGAAAGTLFTACFYFAADPSEFASGTRRGRRRVDQPGPCAHCFGCSKKLSVSRARIVLAPASCGRSRRIVRGGALGDDGHSGAVDRRAQHLASARRLHAFSPLSLVL